MRALNEEKVSLTNANNSLKKKLAEVTATPPVVNFPGTLLLNKPYAQLFTLTNLSTNRSSITWGLPVFAPGSSPGLGADACSVSIEPPTAAAKRTAAPEGAQAVAVRSSA